MSEVNSNSDKITIKIRHSDEDYHDITIDWSNETFDYRKQLFHQLSAYTGIPVEHEELLEVQAPVPYDGAMLNNGEFKNGNWFTEDEVDWYGDDKDRFMRIFHDGDCFLFQTSMLAREYPGITCRHKLVHADYVNESECHWRYCHYMGSRFFTRRISELINSQHLQTVMEHHFYNLSYELTLQTKLNLNFAHFINLACSAFLLRFPSWRVWHNRYLRYRG